MHRDVSFSCSRAWWTPLLWLCLVFFSVGVARSASRVSRFAPAAAPRQDGEQVHALLTESSNLIRAGQARTAFGVDGAGLAVAVLDTGIRATHRDFTDRIVIQQNYTLDNFGEVNNAADGNGQGTHVAGIIAANGTHTGIAPGADIAAIKVLNNAGSSEVSAILNGLDWVIANYETYHISVVNLSFSDGGNYTTKAADALSARIGTLRDLGIAVCAPAGDLFYYYACHQGMASPAIFADTVSVGAVYDADLGAAEYPDGAIARSTAADRVCAFTQRLHSSVHAQNRTDVFAPGADITSAGITSDTSSATAHGTGYATAMVSGVILLLQDYYLSVTETMPTVDQLERWLRAGAVSVLDGDDEDDNVNNTQLIFPRVDALAALQAAEQELTGGYEISGTVTFNGAGLGGVTVNVGTRVTTTAADGTYSVSGLAEGTYTVRPTRTDYSFTPQTRSVTVGPSEEDVDFTATKEAFSIAGTVRLANGSPMSGVTVTAGDRTTSTNASGAFTFTGVSAGTYQVSAFSSGFTFTPASQTVQVGPDQSGIDFTGLSNQTPTYSLSGTVRLGGSGLAGVTVTTGSKSTTTAANGSYTFVGLEQGSYLVTPSQAGYTFTPATRQVTLNSNSLGVDFTAAVATYSVSGTVRLQGAGLPGVTVSAGGRSVLTDGAGRYVFTGLTAGTYLVTPQVSGYAFTPAFVALEVNADRTNVDFTAEAAGFRVGGRVTSGGSGVAGITLSVGDRTVTTDAGGNYLVTDLVAGSYTVRPTSTGYQFTPTSRTVTVGPDRPAVNFTAKTLLQIRGRVTQEGTGLPGITVSAGTRTTVTGDDGSYVLTTLPAGTYTVAASGSGLSFTPPSQTVILSTSNATGVDFSAVMGPHLVSLTPKVTQVKSGKSTTVTVQFDRAVTENVDVLLASSDPAVKVPAKVRVARKKSRAKFTLKTRKVSVSTPVTITASAQGAVVQVTVTVLPKPSRR
jgi:hypothetical protein